jgi:hypothetical protein
MPAIKARIHAKLIAVEIPSVPGTPPPRRLANLAATGQLRRFHSHIATACRNFNIVVGAF